MNERIKELSEQAQLYARQGMAKTVIELKRYDADVASERYAKDFEEKFAELIVRECSQYIEDKFDFCGDEIIIAESVLKHFGVEESRREKFRKSFEEAFKDGVDLSGQETP